MGVTPPTPASAVLRTESAGLPQSRVHAPLHSHCPSRWSGWCLGFPVSAWERGKCKDVGTQKDKEECEMQTPKTHGAGSEEPRGDLPPPVSPCSQQHRPEAQGTTQSLWTGSGGTPLQGPHSPGSCQRARGTGGVLPPRVPGGPGCHSSLHWCRCGSPTRKLYKTILSQPHKIRYLINLS